MTKLEEVARKLRDAEEGARAALIYIRNELEGIADDCADTHFSREDILEELSDLIKEIGD